MYVIFWFFVMCVFGAVSIPFIILFIIGVRKGSHLRIWLGAIPGTGFLTLALLVLLFCILQIHPCSDTSGQATIRRSFVHSFAFEPGPDFIPFHQRIVGINDCGALYLQFKASPATFDRIRTNGYEQLPQWEFNLETGCPYHPSWWRTNNPPSIVCYRNSNAKGP